MTKLLEVKNLKKYFTLSGGRILKAIDNISFSINKGETFGLVGESGCGKTTTGRVITRLYTPTAGSVIYNGENVAGFDKKAAKEYCKKVQMIFQDPYASLDPRMTVEDIVGESMDIHRICKGEERRKRVYNLLEMVGLNTEHATRFPHEFSGGQRQRIGIARALAIDPEFIVCDEPISALDVSIQAQVINLLTKLQKDLNLTYLFIAHDLSMVKYISDRVGVMYLGSIVEITSSVELYKKPLHPYTQVLISAIPIPDPDIESSRSRIKVEGEVPSPINSPKGCKFCLRCPKAMEKCREVAPVLTEVEPDHFVACFLFDETERSTHNNAK